MSRISTATIAFNGAGLALAAFTGAYIIRDAWTVPTTPPCSTRFPSQTEFALKSSSGKPLSPIELQARAGGNEVGLLENAKVVADGGSEVPEYLQVRLAKGGGSTRREGAPAVGGVSFQWNPSGMSAATSACLKYSVWLPDDFDFGGGGELPGLSGSRSDEGGQDEGKVDRFTSRLRWLGDGTGVVNVELPDQDKGRSADIRAGDFMWPRGRWVAVEQEVGLNSPGEGNGILRLWVDGTLYVERADLSWRLDAKQSIASVVSDVSYGGVDNPAVAPVDTALRLSPLSVSWQ